jgi:general secretion pathway protein G
MWGWTLIELLVVLSLIMILAAVSLNMYRNSVWAAKEAALKSNLFHMRDAIDQYYADKAQYPESLEALVAEGYIRTVPDDPFTQSSTTWLTIPAESTPGTLTMTPGIYDVKSGSDYLALDGSRVADW